MKNEGERIMHGYRLDRVIHTGRETDIWAATTGAGTSVALKIPCQSSVPTKEILGKLRWEAEVMGAMDHENVMELVAFHDDGHFPIVVMEYFPGGNVDVLRNQQRNLVDYYLQTILVQTCRGLAHMHSRGYIHRDVKPGNLLMSKTGLIRLIDFSIAQKKTGRWFSRQRDKARIEGTRSYVAPEMLGKKPYDHRADIYSLGITTYVMLTDKFPFTGSSTRELTLKHLKEPASPLTLLDNRIDGRINDLVLSMLEKNPANRPASISEVLQVIQNVPIYR